MNSALPEDVKNLLTELETFLLDVLKAETLSKKGKEKKEILIKRLKDIKHSYPQEFQDKAEDDDQEENDGFPLPPDAVSLASDRDKDEDLPYDGSFYPPVAAQDLEYLKAGYLEKRRKDHSFFASEWQKRWCVFTNSLFYYYGSDKDKQQKGAFSLDGYRAKMNDTLRKDAKKDCCFEIFAPDKRVYQFAASSPKEAEEWINAIMNSRGIIATEDEELYDDVNQEIDASLEEDIYEELPEESEKPVTETETQKATPVPVNNTSGKENTDYANFYRGLWDCTGDHPDELSFKHGDTIYIISKEYNTYGWWVGEMKGTIGLVPKAYIIEMYDI
ncbi:src kinase-associated phosphoprotein 2-B [Xenopus laevis]|uniref:Src kinase-associated phosphoprotein 2-B n=1 Tax=Xenopus laevis TaxID=8355 RepID=SKA2B_XENLA|nr:src kinase-associated phosphoprotein 2-B [Xenopus laevis]Q5U597.1 RecName: Full=Src kinase-associated phosphoprotein 2-B [Xenopus laevis]AAH84787.1 LOC495326 protein [Xenopus laevis]